MSPSVVMTLSNGFERDPRVAKEAIALIGAGHDVRVLAWDRSGALPPTETRDGIAIERFGPVAQHGAGPRNLMRFGGFWRAAGRRAVELAPDIVHCHDLDTAPIGLRAARRLRTCTLVMDFHEYYQGSPMLAGDDMARRVIRKAADALEGRALSKAALVLTVTPGLTPRYEALGAGEKLLVLENAPDAEMFRPRPGERAERDAFVIGYIGKVRHPVPLEALVTIAGRHPDIGALIAGDGTAADRIARAAAGVEGVEITGAFEYEEAPRLYARCDAVYAVYDDSIGNVQAGMPVKGFEAMSCGLPIVSNRGTWFGDYVEEHRIGVTVDSNDPASIERGIVRLKDDPAGAEEMGRRGRRIVDSGLSWAAVSKRLVDAYARLR